MKVVGKATEVVHEVDEKSDEVGSTATDKKRGNRLRHPTGDAVPMLPLDNDPKSMAVVAWESGRQMRLISMVRLPAGLGSRVCSLTTV